MANVGEDVDVEMEDVDEDDEEAVFKSILRKGGEDEDQADEDEEDGRSASIDEDDEEAYLGFLEREQEEGAGEPDEERSSASAGEESRPVEEDAVGSAEKGKGGRKRKNKAEMEGLYAESQRLLRESRGAAFAAQPVVPKPISSVLEKIRARKRQLELGTVVGSSGSWSSRFVSEQECNKAVYADKDVRSSEGREEPSVDQEQGMVDTASAGPQLMARRSEEPIEFVREVGGSVGLETEGDGAAGQTMSNGLRSPDEEAGSISEGLAAASAEQLAQDSPYLLSCSQLRTESDLQRNPDGAGPKDPRSRNSGRSSDEDTDEEEHKCFEEPPKASRLCERKAPFEYIIARAMIDDEAEDEDDDGKGHSSDEDVDENEGDLKDLVAGNVEEKPSDRRKREKLHQEWLAERDQAATDDILHRMKNGWRRNAVYKRAAGFLDEDVEGEGRTGAAKRVCPLEWSRDSNVTDIKVPLENIDKESSMVIEGDEEEVAEEQVLQRRVLEEWQEEDGFLIADNEGSREVLGLINRANLPQPKAKAGSVLPAPKGNTKPSPLKPSFLNLATSAYGNSGKKVTSRGLPSFIFGLKQGKGGASMEDVEDIEVPGKENNAPQVAPGPTGRLSFCRNSSAAIDVWSTPSKPAEGPQLHDLLKIQAASLDRSFRQDAPNSKRGSMSGGIFGGVKSLKSGRGSRRI